MEETGLEMLLILSCILASVVFLCICLYNCCTQKAELNFGTQLNVGRVLKVFYLFDAADSACCIVSMLERLVSFEWQGISKEAAVLA